MDAHEKTVQLPQGQGKCALVIDWVGGAKTMKGEPTEWASPSMVSLERSMTLRRADWGEGRRG